MQWLLELRADRLSNALLNELYDEARIDDLFNYPTRTMAQWIEEHCSERIERLSVTEDLLPSQFFDQPEIIELCRAISDRNFQELERLIETVDVNTQGANGVTPLFWAYFAGNVKAFELLLEAGASPDLKLTSIFKFKKERFGELRPQDSILFTLIRHDRYDFFFRALAYSADVRQSGYGGESLLHTAIRSRNVGWEIMSRLVDTGVDVNARDQSGSHAFQSALGRLSTESIVVDGLKLAADKMSDSMIQSIFDDANDNSNVYSANFREVVEWMEKNIPERIPKSQRQSVTASAIH